MLTVMDKIGKAGLVPVVVIEDANDALSVAKAILNGGLNVMEITLRTKAGIQSMQKVSEEYPEIVLGAGNGFVGRKGKRKR